MSDAAVHVHAVLAEVLLDPDFVIFGERPTTARAINAGGCGEFADRLVERLRAEGHIDAFVVDGFDLGRGILEGEHLWVWWRGRHYDAECAQGVEDWRDLPFWSRCSRAIRRKNPRGVETVRLKVMA